MDRVRVWSIGKRAERFGQLPSNIVGVRHPVMAYWFDEAVDWFCGWLEGKLAERDDKGKPLYRLDRLLGTAEYAVVRRKGK